MNKELRDAIARYKEARLTRELANRDCEKAMAALREVCPEGEWIEMLGFRVRRQGHSLRIRQIDPMPPTILRN